MGGFSVGLCLSSIQLSSNHPLYSYSYTYIDKSIRNGTLENLEDHAVGPPAGTVRSAGSVIQPAKATRTKFTQEDDRELWLWVEKTPQQGGGTDGNEIYKQLEEKVRRAFAEIAFQHIDHPCLCRTRGTHGSHGEIGGLSTSRKRLVRLLFLRMPLPRRPQINPPPKTQPSCR